jgi:hypothetical protein
MSIVLDLPDELERKLAVEASSRGLPLEMYVLEVLAANGRESGIGIDSGSALVSYWQQEGLVGARTDIVDSQLHARAIRSEAERRGS